MGAGLAALGGLPAAGLVGSTGAVAAVALAGARAFVPGWLRDAAFASVGCALGAGVPPGVLAEILRWPVSLAILMAALAAMLAVSTALLRRGFGLGATTALLSSSPGALSYTVALVAEGRGDARAVIVLQSVRLFAITLGLPLILGLAVEVPDVAGTTTGATAGMGWPATLAIFAGAWGTGALAAGAGVPAAHLVAGLMLSAGAHVAGLVEGPAPAGFVLAALCLTGAVIGARFRGVSLGEMARYSLAAGCVVLASTAIAAVAALVATAMVGVSFGQAWVTYAPGGVEAMAAMALALDYDPAFVAVHHIVRIVALIAVLPMLLRWVGPDRAGA